MNTFWQEHAGTIYLTEIICILFMLKITKYLQPRVSKSRPKDFLRYMSSFMIGVYGGFGLVRLYFQYWPSDPTFSLAWVNSELAPFLAATTIIIYATYGALVILRMVKHPGRK